MVALAGTGWNLAPSLATLVEELDDVFPKRDRTSDGSIGDVAHAGRESDHNPYAGWVHAVDLDENVTPDIDLAPLWAHLVATKDPRIRYLIYEGRIIKSYVDTAGHPAWKSYPYTGINAHLHHLHVSIIRTAPARDNTHPWGVAAAYTTEENDDMAVSDEDVKKIADAVIKRMNSEISGVAGARLDPAWNRAQAIIEGPDSLLRRIVKKLGA